MMRTTIMKAYPPRRNYGFDNRDGGTHYDGIVKVVRMWTHYEKL